MPLMVTLDMASRISLELALRIPLELAARMLLELAARMLLARTPRAIVMLTMKLRGGLAHAAREGSTSVALRILQTSSTVRIIGISMMLKRALLLEELWGRLALEVAVWDRDTRRKVCLLGRSRMQMFGSLAGGVAFLCHCRTEFNEMYVYM